MKFKTLLFAVFAAGMGIALSGCPNPDVTIVEIGNVGGSGISDAYALSDGVWAYGYISEESGSRWYSLPAVNQKEICIKLFGGGGMADVEYLIYNESGTQFNIGPYAGDRFLIPNKTEKWFIGVSFRYFSTRKGSFGIGYSTSDSGTMSSKPDYWE